MDFKRFLNWMRLTSAVLLAGPVMALAQNASHHDAVVHGPPQELTDTQKKDFSIRTIGTLRVSNRLGKIRVKGWGLEKIRVIAERKVTVYEAEGAEKVLESVGFDFKEEGNWIEVLARQGKGLSLKEKIEKRNDPTVSLDLTVFAPSNLKLQIWSLEGGVVIEGWKDDVSIRSTRGKIAIKDVRANDLSVVCLNCPISLQKIKSNVRCVAGNQSVELTDVISDEVFVETLSGRQTLQSVTGKQLYVTKEGEIVGHSLRGRVEFQSTLGSIRMEELEGFLSGRSANGDIVASVSRWKFQDKGLIETDTGDIELKLPSSFSSELEVWSLHGQVDLEFDVRRPPHFNKFGPEPENRFYGLVGAGGEQLKVFSKKGNIKILRGA